MTKLTVPKKICTSADGIAARLTTREPKPWSCSWDPQRAASESRFKHDSAESRPCTHHHHHHHQCHCSSPARCGHPASKSCAETLARRLMSDEAVGLFACIYRALRGIRPRALWVSQRWPRSRCWCSRRVQGCHHAASVCPVPSLLRVLRGRRRSSMRLVLPPSLCNLLPKPQRGLETRRRKRCLWRIPSTKPYPVTLARRICRVCPIARNWRSLSSTQSARFSIHAERILSPPTELTWWRSFNTRISIDSTTRFATPTWR